MARGVLLPALSAIMLASQGGYTSSGTQGHTTALNDCVTGRSLLYPTVISRDLLCVLCRFSTRIHVMCGRYSGYRRPRLAMVLHTMHRLWIIGDASQRARAPARFAGRCLSTACQTRVRKGNDSASTAPAASTACLLHPLACCIQNASTPLGVPWMHPSLAASLDAPLARSGPECRRC